MAIAAVYDSVPDPRPAPGASLTGIIDIGSNSIRLVVYRGLLRTPHVLFNEKVMAGLGRGVAATGRLTAEGMAAATTALSRFALLASEMGVARLRIVATAAVREATNRREFVETVRTRCGLDIDIIDGDAEARFSALGVIAGIPDADGIVGDLGGGSLELVRISGGVALERVSLPIGSLKIDAVRKKNSRALPGYIQKALDRAAFPADALGRPFYMVGGSWRALTQVHMHLTDYPLPVVHQYVMTPDTPDRMVRTLTHMQPASLKAIPSVSGSRIPSLPGAAMLLRAVTQRLQSSELIASAYGLREGLLFEALPDAVRREDPLLAGTRSEGERQGRFAGHGDALMAWMDPLFAGEAPALRRIRFAACLLSDVAWRAHPDFRAERGLDVALHGNWVAITAHERVLVGAALFTCFGGALDHPAAAILHNLADPSALEQARLWGLALRLGQRLGGGTVAALGEGGLRRNGGDLELALAPVHAALAGDSVARRLRALANGLGLTPRLLSA